MLGDCDVETTALYTHLARDAAHLWADRVVDSVGTDVLYPAPYDDVQPQADMALAGTVKFYDPARGFGFAVPDDGGREVFVHASVLLRSGLADLQQGQRVLVRAESVPRGLQATEIEPI